MRLRDRIQHLYLPRLSQAEARWIESEHLDRALASSTSALVRHLRLGFGGHRVSLPESSAAKPESCRCPWETRGSFFAVEKLLEFPRRYRQPESVLTAYLPVEDWPASQLPAKLARAGQNSESQQLFPRSNWRLACLLSIAPTAKSDL